MPKRSRAQPDRSLLLLCFSCQEPWIFEQALAHADDCLTAPNSPRRMGTTGIITWIRPNSASVGTCEQRARQRNQSLRRIQLHLTIQRLHQMLRYQ